MAVVALVIAGLLPVLAAGPAALEPTDGTFLPTDNPRTTDDDELMLGDASSDVEFMNPHRSPIILILCWPDAPRIDAIFLPTTLRAPLSPELEFMGVRRPTVKLLPPRPRPPLSMRKTLLPHDRPTSTAPVFMPTTPPSMNDTQVFLPGTNQVQDE